MCTPTKIGMCRIEEWYPPSGLHFGARSKANNQTNSSWRADQAAFQPHQYPPTFFFPGPTVQNPKYCPKSSAWGDTEACFSRFPFKPIPKKKPPTCHLGRADVVSGLPRRSSCVRSRLIRHQGFGSELKSMPPVSMQVVLTAGPAGLLVARWLVGWWVTFGGVWGSLQGLVPNSEAGGFGGEAPRASALVGF